MTPRKHVSEISRNTSRGNIELKLATLEAWAKDGIPWACDGLGQPQRDAEGELALDWFPTSIVAFASWTGAQNSPFVQASLPKLKTCSRETLYKEYNRDLNARVTSLLKSLRQRALLQREQNNKTSHLRLLKAELAHWRALAESQTTQLVQIRQRTSAIEIELRNEQRARNENNAILNERLNERDKRIAELTATLTSLSPLHAKRRSK